MLCIAIMSGACSDNDAPQATGYTAITNTTTRSSDENGIISFENIEDYSNFLLKIKALPSHEAKLAFMHDNYPSFVSCQDIYSNAMIEMENDVDETKESYLNFKDKYNTLYFPMHGEDAGFYIPIKDLDAAYLTNKDYKIRISGTDICLKDINSYEELMATGRAYYEESKPMPTGEMTEFSLNNNSINSVGPEYDSGWAQYDKRRVKLKARRRFESFSPAPTISGSKSLFHTEFCFRKKTLFGWSNSDSTSSISGTVKIPGTRDLTLSSSHSGMSSHDKDYEIPVFIHAENGFWFYTCPELTCNATVVYRGVAHPLEYNWVMGGAYAKTTYSANHAYIYPFIER